MQLDEDKILKRIGELERAIVARQQEIISRRGGIIELRKLLEEKEEGDGENCGASDKSS